MTKIVGRRTRRPDTVKAVIARRTVVDDNGCWIWQGRVLNSGYGQLRWKPEGVQILGAHRVSYWAHVGPVADGLWLDHLCRNRLCCNPAHLEPVTPRENIMRSPIAIAALNARKTHCPQGHEYASDNIYRNPHGRVCRACHLLRAAERRF